MTSSDKGCGIAILNNNTYVEKLNLLLSETDTYEKKMKKQKIITETQKFHKAIEKLIKKEDKSWSFIKNLGYFNGTLETCDQFEIILITVVKSKKKSWTSRNRYSKGEYVEINQ